MHRKAKIPGGMEKFDFFELAKKEKHPRVRLRLLALGHFKNGKKAKEIGEFLDVGQDALREWRTRFSEQGLAGLREGHRSGAHPRLKREDEARFVHALEELQSERKGGRGTWKEIQKLLHEQFHVTYSQNGVYGLLKRLKVVWVSARPKHPRSDAKVQETFKKTSQTRFKR